MNIWQEEGMYVWITGKMKVGCMNVWMKDRWMNEGMYGWLHNEWKDG